MTLVLLTAILAGTGQPALAADHQVLVQAAAEIAPDLQTGSLIFSEGDCLAIKVYVGGPYTHVAVVVVDRGGPVVYDSMNGGGVRKLPLEEYLVTQSPDTITLLHPARPLTGEEAEELQGALESRVGTPYAVMHHLTGERSEEGVHCAEYATDALMAIRLIHAERPSKVSPSSLADGVVQHNVYTPGETIELDFPAAELAGDNWCEQLWIDTRLCCTRCCRQLSAWFLCR